MKVTRSEYEALKATGTRTFVNDIGPYSGEISEGFALPDGGLVFEKLDFGMASYSHFTPERLAEGRNWKMHKIADRNR